MLGTSLEGDSFGCKTLATLQKANFYTFSNSCKLTRIRWVVLLTCNSSRIQKCSNKTKNCWLLLTQKLRCSVFIRYLSLWSFRFFWSTRILCNKTTVLLIFRFNFHISFFIIFIFSYSCYLLFQVKLGSCGRPARL